MATLLVALAVMSVLMSAVLPAWRHQAQREKEAELAFRGEQYMRAIQLWERKMGPGSRPPNIDMLVQQKFLRKKYKDPMTEDGEFQPVFAGVNPTAPGAGRGGQRGQPPQQQQPPPTPQTQGQIAGGGIHGVMSKSKETSIRIYKGATRYNEWRFIHAGAATTPGGRGGSPVPGGPGGRSMPGGIDGGRRGGFPPGVGPGGRGGTGGRGTSDGRGIQSPGFPGPAGPGRGRGQ
jgi:type II secretory pathway pseudopilin PulG